MRTKHRRTLENIFKKPTPTDIRWMDVVALLKAVDINVSQRSGARVLLKRGEQRMVVHRPHPEPETGKATARNIAAFLKAIGVQP